MFVNSCRKIFQINLRKQFHQKSWDFCCTEGFTAHSSRIWKKTIKPPVLCVGTFYLQQFCVIYLFIHFYKPSSFRWFSVLVQTSSQTSRQHSVLPSWQLSFYWEPSVWSDAAPTSCPPLFTNVSATMMRSTMKQRFNFRSATMTHKMQVRFKYLRFTSSARTAHVPQTLLV